MSEYFKFWLAKELIQAAPALILVGCLVLFIGGAYLYFMIPQWVRKLRGRP